MATNRRDFIRNLLMATAGAHLLDIDKLLWVPKPIITVPAMPTNWITVMMHNNVMDPILTDIAVAYHNPGYIADRVFPQIGAFVAVDERGRAIPADIGGRGRIVGVCVGPSPGKNK